MSAEHPGSTAPVPDAKPRRPRRLALLAAGVVAYLASRVPLLLHSPDWRPMSMEHHCFSTSIPALVHALETTSEVPRQTLAAYAPEHFGRHYHEGANYVAESVRALIALGVPEGLLPLKLTGLIASTIAFVVWFAVVSRVWREHRPRVVAAMTCAWLAPPSMYLWTTLLPPGHYMETWLFHALFLPPVLAICMGTLPRWGPAALGVACGWAAIYTASNLAFAGWFSVLLVLAPGRTALRRVAAVAQVWGLTLALWGFFITRPERWPWFSERFDEGTREGVLTTVREGLRQLLSPSVVHIGDQLSQRGAFSLLETTPGDPVGIRAAGVMLFVSILGAVAISAWAIASAVPGRFARMSVEARFLAAQGILFLGLFLFWLLFGAGPRAGMASYLLLVLPPVWLGVGWVVSLPVPRAAAWVRALRWGSVAALAAFLAWGWGSTVAENSRELDRPGLPQCDAEYIGVLAKDATSSADLEERCLRARPGNHQYCERLAWTLGPMRNAATCRGLTGHEELACGTAAGRRMDPTEASRCRPDVHGRFDGVPASCCAPLTGAARHSCLVAALRPEVFQLPNLPFASQDYLCRRLSAPGTWRYRACMEGTASVIPLFPAGPVATEPAPEACQDWPVALLDSCRHAMAARPAEEGEQSCEEVYAAEYRARLPDEESLFFGACLRVEGYVEGEGLYPFCAIGAARRLLGEDCRWRGGRSPAHPVWR